jgi:hypothetical protein
MGEEEFGMKKSRSIRDGVLTARETEAQRTRRSAGVQASLALGSHYPPV